MGSHIKEGSSRASRYERNPPVLLFRRACVCKSPHQFAHITARAIVLRRLGQMSEMANVESHRAAGDESHYVYKRGDIWDICESRF